MTERHNRLTKYLARLVTLLLLQLNCGLPTICTVVSAEPITQKQQDVESAQIPQGTIVADVDEKMVIAILELEVLGKTHPGEDDTDRLIRVEKALFADDYDGYSHSNQTRFNEILKINPPSSELVGYVQEKCLSDATWLKEPQSVDWKSTLLQRTSLLELAMYRTISPKSDLTDRISKLEKDFYGKDASTIDGDLSLRTNNLILAIEPPEDLINRAVKRGFPLTWPAGAPASAAFGMLGRGAKKIGKGLNNATADTAAGIKRVLSSPTFWQLVAAGGAITVLAIGYKKGWFNGLGSTGNATYIIDNGEPPNGCHGEMSCTICRDCSRCYHCNRLGGSCGVSLSVRGY